MFLGNFAGGRLGWALLALTVAVAPGCRATKPGETQEVVPELRLEGVRFRVHREGRLRLLGEAGAVSLRRDSSELRAADLVARLPRPGGEVRITAPSAQGVVSERRYAATGGVTVSRGTDVVRTARARWEPGATGGRVVGEDPVVVEGSGYRLEGRGFTLDPASSVVNILGEARLVAGRGAGR